MAGRIWDWSRFGRLLLVALGCATPVVAAIFLLPWLGVAVAPYKNSRTAIALLIGLEVAYGVVLLASLIGFTIFGALVIRARRRGMSRPGPARALLLCGACLLAFALAESGAALLRASIPPVRSFSPSDPLLIPARVPELPTEFSESGGDGEITLVVLGESSATGVPFQPWFSVGDIVAWKLGEVIPGRRFRVLMLAKPGDTLEGQYRKLARLRRRPDALIVYCGHNEFAARIPWSRRVRHYRDERLTFSQRVAELARRSSPLYRLIEEAADKYRIEQVPTGYVKPVLVDVPTYTQAQLVASVSDFRRLLEAITAHGERIGALPILVVPPANDGGYEPNRSFLPAETFRAEREAFARDFMIARSLEATDPERAIEQYRDLLARQPGFAESHYRLARLLSDTGAWAEAYQHDVAARDFDGMPMRCLTPFQEAYHEVAARHDCAFVDGQALFHKIGLHGLLDDDLFFDAMHPALRGHIALASSILEALHARRAFGWPSEAPTPAIDPAQCADHFGLRSQDWKPLCVLASKFYSAAATIRFDPSHRLAQARALEAAAERMDAGEPPEAVGLANVGIPPAMPAPPPARAAPEVLKAPPNPL